MRIRLRQWTIVGHDLGDGGAYRHPTNPRFVLKSAALLAAVIAQHSGYEGYRPMPELDWTPATVTSARGFPQLRD